MLPASNKLKAGIVLNLTTPLPTKNSPAQMSPVVEKSCLRVGGRVGRGQCRWGCEIPSGSPRKDSWRPSRMRAHFPAARNRVWRRVGSDPPRLTLVNRLLPQKNVPESESTVNSERGTFVRRTKTARTTRSVVSSAAGRSAWTSNKVILRAWGSPGLHARPHLLPPGLGGPWFTQGWSPGRIAGCGRVGFGFITAPNMWYDTNNVLILSGKVWASVSPDK